MSTQKTAPKQRTFNQIQAEIARLNKEAEAIKAMEAPEVLAKIKEAIKVYGFTATDVGFVQAVKSVPKAPSAVKSKGKIKFSDGQNAWTGIGRVPKWYTAALAAGKTPDDLRVKQ